LYSNIRLRRKIYIAFSGIKFMKENYPGEYLVESQPDEEDREQGRQSHKQNTHNSVYERRQNAAKKFKGIGKTLEKSF